MRRYACRLCRSSTAATLLAGPTEASTSITVKSIAADSSRRRSKHSQAATSRQASSSTTARAASPSTSSPSASTDDQRHFLPDFLKASSSSSSQPSSIHAGSKSNSRDNASSPFSSSMPIFDPLQLVGNELSTLRNNLQQLLGSGHPALDTIAKYYFQAEGKHIRPMIVLLMSQATNGLAPGFDERRKLELSGKKQGDSSRSIDDPLEVRAHDILNDVNPNATSASSSASALSNLPSTSNVLPSQRRLAEITEMIHVASLLHDDVIDTAATRRAHASAPAAFGNKLSILGGDFLLARASLYLSRLGSNEVVELVASVLANLVEGEVMQIKGNAPDSASSPPTKLTPEIFQHYMKKTYLKTASLIAKSSRATTVLGGAGEKQGWIEGERIKDIAYSYGRNLGIAFQLVDDLLDFTATAADFGKPSDGADLKLGLATAPALYAWDEFPEMGEMILRKFEQEGDVEKARDIVRRSSGPAQTAALAEAYAQQAMDALKGLPESEAREALEGLTRTVLKRTR